MATQTSFQQRDFKSIIYHWNQRLRLQQVVDWLPRSLMPGAVIGIVIAIISRLYPLLNNQQIIIFASLLMLSGIVVLVMRIWLWPRSTLNAARQFDITFGLQERVSTALEIIDGRIHANDEFAQLQIDDAWNTAHKIKAADFLPLHFKRREWLILLFLTSFVILLAVLPNPQAEAIGNNSAEQVAIEQAREELQQITQDVASDPSLSPEEREALLEALQASLDTLKEPNLTPEEAFATLSDAQTTLESQSEQINREQAAMNAAMNAAMEPLQNLQSEIEPGESGQPESTQQLLSQIQESLSGFTPAQMQALSNALQQAAQQLQFTNPELAQALQQAAEQLQQGNTAGAQQALQQAANAAQQAEQNQIGQQDTAEQLNQSAENLQDAANQISQASVPSNQGQQQNQQGQQNGQQSFPNSQASQQNGNQQQANSQQGQSSQNSQQSGAQQGQTQQSGAQQGQQSNQSGQEGGSEGNQPGTTNEVGSGGQSGQNGDTPSESSQGGASSGAGDSPGGQGSNGGQNQQAGTPGQNNNPDGQGEGQFESIYAPQRIGGEGNENIQLEANSSDQPIQEGNFSNNPAGNTSVPYNQVFSDYSNAANQALQSDYIPLGLRDVVHDYFSSLEPGRSSSNSR